MIRNAQRALAAILLSLALSQQLSAGAPASGINYQQALQEAEAIIDSQEHWQLMRGQGVSMEPLFGDNSFLMVQDARVEQLREGMVVVYRDAQGDLVAHTITHVEANAAQAKGINNFNADPEHVTNQNLVGVVFGYLHTKDAPATDSLPIALGKTYN